MRLLVILFLISALLLPVVPSVTANHPPTAQEIAARAIVDGFSAFTLRGWRVDFTEAGGISGDCPFVIGFFNVRSSFGSKVVYHTLTISLCDGYYVRVQDKEPEHTTENEAVYKSKERATETIQTKPSFGLREIFLQGAFIRSPRGMLVIVDGDKRTPSKTSIEITVPALNDSWVYMAWEDKNGAIHLEPSGMTRGKLTYK